MTVFLTVLAGVITFVLGQLVLVLVIHPLQDFRRTIADVAHALIEHANVYANPNPSGMPTKQEMVVSEEFRKLSSRLFAQMHLVPKYGILSNIFRLPSIEDVTEAATRLIALSHFRQSTGAKNSDRADEVRKLLAIRQF